MPLHHRLESKLIRADRFALSTSIWLIWCTLTSSERLVRLWRSCGMHDFRVLPVYMRYSLTQNRLLIVLVQFANSVSGVFMQACLACSLKLLGNVHTAHMLQRQQDIRQKGTDSVYGNVSPCEGENQNNWIIAVQKHTHDIEAMARSSHIMSRVSHQGAPCGPFSSATVSLLCYLQSRKQVLLWRATDCSHPRSCIEKAFRGITGNKKYHVTSNWGWFGRFVDLMSTLWPGALLADMLIRSEVLSDFAWLTFSCTIHVLLWVFSLL